MQTTERLITAKHRQSSVKDRRRGSSIYPPPPSLCHATFVPWKDEMAERASAQLPHGLLSGMAMVIWAMHARRLVRPA